MKYRVAIIWYIVLCMTFVCPVYAANSRLALVIGNAQYKNNPLKNPENDAHDIANMLKELGFDVIVKTNVDKRTMKTAIREFGRRLQAYEVGLFYFSGHGVQYQGKNYLIPLHIDVESETDIEYETIEGNYILAQMDQAQNNMNIVILDACRNNPFTRSFTKSLQKGLAVMEAPTGSVLAFATAPNTVAFDGVGRNGVFTKHLLNALQTKSHWSITDLFIDVTAHVTQETNGKQVPWQHVSLTKRFAFSGVLSSPGAPAQASQHELSSESSLAPNSLERPTVVRAKFYARLYGRPKIQSSTIVGNVQKGDRLTVIAAQEEWFQVNTSENVTGWIPTYQVLPARTEPLTTIQSPPVPAMQTFSTPFTVYAKFYARMYSLPEAKSSTIVSSVQKGNRLKVTAEQGEWYLVETPLRKIGWIAKYQVSQR